MSPSPSPSPSPPPPDPPPPPPAPAPRVASLLPSATDICVSLGLADAIVGVTHECDLAGVLGARTDGDGDGDGDGTVLILTGSLIDSGGRGQGEIDARVREAAAAAAAAAAARVSSCAPPVGTAAPTMPAVESLYPIREDRLRLARPTVVLTQNLCGVCAPSTGEVRSALAGGGGEGEGEGGAAVDVVSLEPRSLSDVADTFASVAEACGVPDRGEALRDEFRSKLRELGETVAASRLSSPSPPPPPPRGGTRPRVLLLEWLVPPYDGGHWIPELIEAAGCDAARVGPPPPDAPAGSWDGTKSRRITWDRARACDPDVVLVACCGFDLRRNVEDAVGAAEELGRLTAAGEGRVYACDGDLYFARPGPKLLGGAAIVAQCAFDGVDAGTVAAVQGLDFAPREGGGWSRVDVMGALAAKGREIENGEAILSRQTRPSDVVHDIEDLATQGDDFTAVHRAACDAGAMHYVDPATGYHVFTELAHKKRGKCCGSGCRHCPFSHENVSPENKAGKIMQPAFLHDGDMDGPFSIRSKKRIKVLFFSGGKDSFLAVRALVRRYSADPTDPFGIVLLTTFDASSRIIAHQEVHIDRVLRQARHLGLPLVGVPVHQGSSERYVHRIRRGLDAVSARAGEGGSGGGGAVLSLVFGDLHLEHIRSWRDKELGAYELEYPLWGVPYHDLMNDLESSGVRCVVSASTRVGVKEGDVFDEALRRSVEGMGMDGFGEEGEFHTVAEVWEVSQEMALGLATGGK